VRAFVASEEAIPGWMRGLARGRLSRFRRNESSGFGPIPAVTGDARFPSACPPGASLKTFKTIRLMGRRPVGPRRKTVIAPKDDAHVTVSALSGAEQ